MDGLPHIYRVATDGLPAGLLQCGCCDRMVRHTEVGAFDKDLVSYVCWRCITPLAVAEWVLIAPASEGGQIRARRPNAMEAMALDEWETGEQFF